MEMNMENDEIRTGKGMTLQEFVKEILAERIDVEWGGYDEEGFWDGFTRDTKNYSDADIATEAVHQDVIGAFDLWKKKTLVKKIAAIRKTLEIAGLGKKK